MKRRLSGQLLTAYTSGQTGNIGNSISFTAIVCLNQRLLSVPVKTPVSWAKKQRPRSHRQSFQCNPTSKCLSELVFHPLMKTVLFCKQTETARPHYRFSLPYTQSRQTGRELASSCVFRIGIPPPCVCENFRINFGIIKAGVVDIIRFEQQNSLRQDSSE